MDDSEHKYRAIFESLPDIFIRTRLDGTIVEINSAVTRLLGYSKEEALGCRSVDWYASPEDRERLLETILAEGYANDYEIRLRKQNGDLAHFSITSRLIQDEPADGAHVQSILRDITFRKQSEQRLQIHLQQLTDLNQRLQETQYQLIQSEKMASIGQLAAGVAHEINNPVGYVSSNLGTLEGYLRNLFAMIDAYEQAEAAIADEQLKKRLLDTRSALDLEFLKGDVFALLSESKEGLDRVKKIVRDLTEFSHAGKNEEWQWSDLHRGLDSTLNIAWSELKYKAEVIRNYGSLPNIQCLSSQINQVFMNILVNASHAIELKGTITIATGCSGAEVYVRISDDGKGIAAKHINRIYEPFFTTRAIGKGTGLGLSLSYAIVKKHNGRIEVESQPGKGTTFTVVLPIRQDGIQERS
jgi:PAS domain S-box-containing protein